MSAGKRFTLILMTVIAAAALGLLLFVRFSGEAGPAATASPPATQVPGPTPSPTPEPTPSPTPEPTPSPTPEPEPEYFVLSMVGDCTLSSSQLYPHFEYILDGDMSWPFSSTVQYFEDDYLTIANLECSLSSEKLYGSTTFWFCGPAEHAQILVDGGVDFVTMANNHALDFGQKGIDNTKSTLDSYGIAYAGANESYVFQREDGISVGLFAAKWLATQAEISAGVSALAQREDVDIVVCLMHWGNEGSYRVTASQTQLGQAAIDAGADIVYGSHPHVLQQIDEYNGGYIVYSLGNYSFGGNTSPRDRDTAIVQFTVKRDVDGTVSVEGWEAIPCRLSSTASYNDYRPEPYEEGSEEYERTMSKLLGTFTGPDLTIDYSQYHDQPEDTAAPETAAEASPETAPDG